MANNTPARIFLNGVEQHHCRDWRTGPDGFILKRKQWADGSVIVDPVTRQFELEYLTGEVVAIGDDRFVGETLQPPSQDSSARPPAASAPRITEMNVTFNDKGVPFIQSYKRQ